MTYDRGFRTLAKAAVLLALLLAFLGQLNPLGVVSMAMAGSSGPLRPVLVLEEPQTKGLPASLDSPDGKTHPMVSYLVKAGYVLGTNVFVIASEEPFFSIPAGSDWVSQAVAGVLSRTGASQIDLIAYGVTGLASRHAIESETVPHSKVKNLVMVSSPNKGTFVAELLKSLSTKAVLESMWEKATRVERYLQLLPDRDEPSDSKDSLKRWVPESTPWQDEITWIIQRSERVYEPLYARYVAQRYYSIPYVPLDSPNKTFAGWLSENAPRMWESVIRKGTSPPVPDGSSGAKGSRPGLSSAYYELLAMDVARNQYVMKTAPQKGLLESLFSEAYVPVDWRDAAFYYGERLLWHYLGKALVTVKAETQKYLADSLLKAAGFSGEPGSPMLEALVREDILVNLGKSMGERFTRVPANVSLASYNDGSNRENPGRATRYISVVGQTLNPWGIVWPQIGPNDLYCEVDCAVPPLGPRDEVKVFHGWFSPSHSGLRDDKKALDYILSMLSGSKEEKPYAVKPLSQGPSLSWATVSSWRPTYLVAERGTPPADTAVVATISVPSPPAGWQYLLWTENESGAVYDPKTQGAGGAVDVGLHEGLKLGIRLVRSGPANPLTIGGKVSSAFSEELLSRVQVSLRILDSSVGGGTGSGGNAGQGSGNGYGSGSPGGPGQPTGSGSQGGTGGQDPDGQVLELPDLPMVRVVYRSKQTTLKEPSETYHEWWDVDWGDGRREVVAGQVSLEMSHRYAEEGKHEATLTSFDSRGKKILTKTFDLYVSGEEDFEQTVRCESIPKVMIDVILSGPAKWITGKPAQYNGHLWTDLGEGVEILEVSYDPGESFLVLWERAGDFTVSVAATVRLRYALEDKEIIVKNTYVQSMPVIVLTTGVTR